MEKSLRRRRNTVLGLVLIACLAFLIYSLGFNQPAPTQEIDPVETVELDADDTEIDYLGEEVTSQPLAIQELAKLAIRETASKTGYARDQFLTSGAWDKWSNGCTTRERILGRDLDEILYGDNGCTVMSGILNDPYTGKTINFTRGTSTSGAVQIDHVVALSNAWRTGAQDITRALRKQFANDDLNLLAVDGPANMQKSDHDASEWLPSNKSFQCEYIARQIAVKIKYLLWLTQPEHDTMFGILQTCPEQEMPEQ